MNHFMPTRYVRIGDQKIELLSSGSRNKNPNFYDRDTKHVTIRADYDMVKQLVDGNEGWSTIETYSASSEELVPYNATEILRDDYGNVIGFSLTYDHSDYNILGNITVHNDGTVTIEYGKPSELDKTKAALDAMVYAALTE